MAFDGDAFRLRDSKGLRYLSVLLAAPGREIHSLELVSAVEGYAPPQMPSDTELRPGAGDAGQILDARAKAEYAHRLPELESELAEAEEWHDPERASRLRQEIDFLASELGAAVGLGGRDRTCGLRRRTRTGQRHQGHQGHHGTDRRAQRQPEPAPGGNRPDGHILLLSARSPCAGDLVELNVFAPEQQTVRSD